MNRPLIVSALLAMFILSACTSGQASAPTIDPALIKTQAVETIMAQLTQTEIALATENAPTATPMMTATPTLTATPAITNTPAPCADAAWVKDITVPDGTIMKPGETFTKTWRIKNIGSCTWREDFYLIFGYGEKMGGTEVALPSKVEPEQEVEISISLTAPKNTGEYYGWWRLKNEWGAPFGEFFGVSITVQ